MRPVMIFILAILVGCAEMSTIHLASSSKSPFDGAVYSGISTEIAKAPSGVDEYRVYHQGATSFVTLEMLRAEAESRATTFCARSSKAMLRLREVDSKPPHILGNFPRVELIFSCIDRSTTASNQPVLPKPSASTGTGFLLRNALTLVTAYHVIENANTITVTCGGGHQASATVERIDPSNDLALLHLSSPAQSYVELAPENSLVIGQKVFTIGFPVPELLGGNAKYSDGAISSLTGIHGAANVLQITVPIQPGNSGGPLIDESGRVVGVITSSAAVQGFLRRTGTLPQNINWAVRSEYVQPLLAGVKLQTQPSSVKPVKRAELSVCLIKATN